MENGSFDILKVIWAYGQWQTLYEEQIPGVNIRYVEGLPSEEEILSDKPHLVKIDDLMSHLYLCQKIPAKVCVQQTIS